MFVIKDLKQMTVRLVRDGERRRWDKLMNQHQALGFKGFVGRGLR